MSKKVFWLSIVGIFISFAGGFLLANALNRGEMDGLRAENSRLKSAPPVQTDTDASQNLTDDEINQKLAEADQNSENLIYQKNLGTALYRYAIVKRETKWLDSAVRLLERVHAKNPQDYDVIVTLGNIYLDKGIDSKQADAPEEKSETNQNLSRAREFYQQAENINQKDADVLTNQGLTFFYAQPPDNKQAFQIFQKSLKVDPKNEKTLEATARVLINDGKYSEAEKFVNQIKEVNPKSESLNFLQEQIAKGKNNQ